jgi:hypothetical protein
MNTLEFCKKYLYDYTINHDNIVDVYSDVDLYNALGDMKKLPVKFGRVFGWFTCSENKLTTLKGSPSYVDDNFSCYANKLKTLDGCPNYIGGNFYCNNLTHHILGNVCDEIYIDKQRIVI